MGYELYRMIIDGAPESWTPAMRLVAMVIADDARPDPSQGLMPDGGWPLSKIRLHGHYADDGQWHDGLAERTGMSDRVISRALTELAAAGYEMREQIDIDKHGRSVFAYPWRARRFRVPVLPPRKPPDRVVITNTTETATYTRLDPATFGTTETATFSTTETASRTEQPPQVAGSGSEDDQIRPPARSPDPATSYPSLPIPNPSRRTTRTGSRGDPAATDDDYSSSRHADLDGHAEGRAWSGQPDDDDLPDYETRPRRSPGLGQCAACGGWFLIAAMGLINRHKGTRPDGSYGTCPGARQPPVRPVRCAWCGRTGLALASLSGLCAACTRERKETEAEGTP